jgi:hypothetical protein
LLIILGEHNLPYLTVTTHLDLVAPGDGQLSLREALTLANASGGSDTIRFSAAVVGKTLVLTGGELAVTADVTIDGNNGGAAVRTTIDGARASRVLRITGGGTEAKLNGLILTNGRSSDEPGGGILVDSRASLAMTDSTVTRNNTSSDDGNGADGGGIFVASAAQLTLDHAIVSDNMAGRFFHLGGGIATYGGDVTIRNSTITRNISRFGGGLALDRGSTAAIEASIFSYNHASSPYNDGGGGAVHSESSVVTISHSSIVHNQSRGAGGGLNSVTGHIAISDSTISSNRAIYAGDDFFNRGGGIWASGYLVIRNSTVTGNSAGEAATGVSRGGGIHVVLGTFDIANSVVAGNFAKGSAGEGPDIFGDSIGGIIVSNGHNIFGSDVPGNVPGDRENVAPTTLFAAIDSRTGGGLLSPKGIVPLRKNLVSNPALSGGDPLAASATGQLGTTRRPLPVGSLPDIGAAEADQTLSTSPTTNNDVITGSSAANNLAGLAGNDLIRGLAGNDVLNGGPGGDVLEGGPGNDRLNGGNGVDIATFAGTTAVVVDLSTDPATAKRGGETDTLTSIEGAIGSDKADTFKGDANNNEFQGGLGKDTYTGRGGRDLYAFKRVQDSPAGSGRDVIKDFVPNQDVIDVANIDADSSLPRDQSFRWVGKATLTEAAQIGYYVSGGNTIVRASTDADGKAEFEIQLNGVKTLTLADFRL